jgi:hypothetical protein
MGKMALPNWELVFPVMGIYDAPPHRQVSPRGRWVPPIVREASYMPITCGTHILVRGCHICPVTQNHFSLGAVNNLNMRHKSLTKKKIDLSGKSRVYYISM